MTIFICIFISKQQALDTGYTQNTYEQSQDQVLPIIEKVNCYPKEKYFSVNNSFLGNNLPA